MAKKKSGEGLPQFEAFEFWFFMRPRAFDKVAAEFHVTPTCVRQWAAKYNWEERAEDREKKIKADIANNNDAAMVKQRATMIQVAQATIARYAARLLKRPEDRDAQGVTQYEPTAVDAIRAAQLQILLGGGATSRTDVTMGPGFAAALLALVGAVLRRELPTACPTCRADLGGLPARISAKLLEASSGLTVEAAATGGPPLGALGRGDSPDEAGPE